MDFKNTISTKDKLTKGDNLSEYYFNFWKQTKFYICYLSQEVLKILDISL